MKISTTLLRDNVMVRVAFSSNVRKHINTGVKIIGPAEFINGVVVNHPDAMDLNAQIGAKVAEVKWAIDLLEAQGVEVTPDTLSKHVTRHSYATLMLSHDMPMAVVLRVLVHTDINVTQLYAKITSDKVESATSKLCKS